MELATRSLVIGCTIEALGALPFVFGSAGPCTINDAGLLGLLLNLPGEVIGFGLQALLDLPGLAAVAIVIVAQAVFWTGTVYLVLRLRRRRAIRRADALPTI